VAKAIYGLIAVMAVFVIDEHPPVLARCRHTVRTTLGVALVDAYIETISWMFSRGSVALTHRTASGTPSLLCTVGAQAPTLVLLLAVFGLLSIERAITIAQLSLLLLHTAGASGRRYIGTRFAS